MKVYNLTEIPFKKPSVIKNAAKYLEQKALLDLLELKTPLNRSALLPIIMIAIDEGLIKVVKAHVETIGILDFVDLNSFSDEFNNFINKVKNGETKISVTDIKNVAKSLPKTSPKKLFKNLLYDFTSKKWFLPFFQRFCKNDLEKYFKIASMSLLQPSQIKSEITGLLNLLNAVKPRSVLEIGTNKGGTLYLLSKVSAEDATLASIDIRIINEELIYSTARKEQKIILLEGDSNSQEIINKIRSLFPDGLDFLFIDGDHSYEGVKKDFTNYSPLVKIGGYVAFHDIVEDNESRYGVITGGWAGGVPKFWKEIKSNYDFKEFINNPKQDGAGIGVITV